MADTADASVTVEFDRREAQALLNSSQLVLEASGFMHLSNDATALDWAQLKLAAALDGLRTQQGDDAA